ncbi:MAG: NTP transferase domain-containing protein [bacterium]|nr:NTP transferase domain-containing protein [bacterium]
MIERGPVGAMLGLFNSNVAQHYLVVGCDQPLLTADLLRLLLVEIDERPNVICNEDENSCSPLPGLYPASLIPIVQQLLEQPRASLRELLTRSNARNFAIDKTDWLRLRSANTPQDVEDINKILRPENY